MLLLGILSAGVDTACVAESLWNTASLTWIPRFLGMIVSYSRWTRVCWSHATFSQYLIQPGYFNMEGDSIVVCNVWRERKRWDLFTGQIAGQARYSCGTKTTWIGQLGDWTVSLCCYWGLKWLTNTDTVSCVGCRSVIVRVTGQSVVWGAGQW